tara:strand:+ start:11850 stop:12020 length:171 start_codon:yes stop_codon:yes gene_type:complete
MEKLNEWLKPYREWQDTLPFWKRLLVEVISLIIITSPFIFLIWWITGEVWIFLPSA